MKKSIIISAMSLAFASLSQAAFTPIAIQSSSYNADVIVESNATPRLTISTTASIDNGTNNYGATLFEMGRDLANPANGVPLAGSTFTAADDSSHSFTMAPSYTVPNGILIDTVVTNGAFAVVTPAIYTKLSFLCLGGNGGDGIGVIVQHQDGTQENGSFAIPDWFGSSGVALIMNGRINQVANLNTETDGTSGDGRGNPRLYFRDITLSNTTSPVTNIIFNYASGSSGSHNDIMAVSGATPASGTNVVPIAVTGYTYDFIVEAAAPPNGRVTSQTVVNSTNVWATTQSMDNTTDGGASWYEQGYNLNNDDQTGSGTPRNSPLRNLTGTGLPHPGTLVTNGTADHIYQMPPDYTVNDAVYISTVLTNDTITLTTPAAFTGLSFLGSAGNGPVTVNVVINHQSPGTTESQTLTVNDWFNSSQAAGYIANGRVVVSSGQFQSINSGFPRLLQNDITLSDTVNPVTSIYLQNTNTSGGRFAILAISGSAGALPPAIVLAPTSVNAYNGSSVTFTSTASANVAITYQWQKGTNGVYVNLANGGNISGATTTILSINPIGFTDQADYRLVATDIAGFAQSSAGTLTVFSTALDVTQPGDPITALNCSTFGDGAAANAIDNNLGNKFGADINSGQIAALVTSPSMGRTILSALRIYTGNDSTGRDPASYKLEGSVDGGSTYTLISSNSITLPDGRNSSGAPNPLVAYVTEVRFANTSGYTTYKLSFPTYKQAGSTQVQFEEMELLGVVDTSLPYFSTQPTDAKAYGAPTGLGANSATFTAMAVYNPTPTISWFKKSGASYVSLADGGNISGSQTTSLSINPTTVADAADYVAVAYSSSGSITSSVAHLYIYSTNVDVTQPGDTIVSFGDTTGTRYGLNGNAANLIDNTFTEWVNGGSGPSATAGFPPFGGPVGAIVTPSVGSTVVTGIRVYTGQDPAAADPSGYILEGSNDGTNYAAIASGSLALPLSRNSIALAVDPTQSAVQEILFSNTHGYTSYRLTFPSIRDANSAAFLEVGDVEFLGVPGVGVAQPAISSTVFSGGNLTIGGSGGTPSGTFSVQTNANLTQPNGWGTVSSGSFDVTGHFSVNLPVSQSNSKLFFRVRTP